ncbi:hypothetical protein CHUAL_004519 [Chamberlinius hualienensis]
MNMIYSLLMWRKGKGGGRKIYPFCASMLTRLHSPFALILHRLSTAFVNSIFTVIIMLNGKRFSLEHRQKYRCICSESSADLTLFDSVILEKWNGNSWFAFWTPPPLNVNNITKNFVYERLQKEISAALKLKGTTSNHVNVKYCSKVNKVKPWRP